MKIKIKSWEEIEKTLDHKGIGDTLGYLRGTSFVSPMKHCCGKIAHFPIPVVGDKGCVNALGWYWLSEWYDDITERDEEPETLEILNHFLELRGL